MPFSINSIYYIIIYASMPCYWNSNESRWQLKKRKKNFKRQHWVLHCISKWNAFLSWIRKFCRFYCRNNSIVSFCRIFILTKPLKPNQVNALFSTHDEMSAKLIPFFAKPISSWIYSLDAFQAAIQFPISNFYIFSPLFAFLSIFHPLPFSLSLSV